ncbi:hypothetical protein [Rhodopirellula baltica]|uniref:Uncharacterized protein n=1 Tax=Rhodopirellula baltica WH47 TaxID=991778 RepID=F2B1M1_RHOBT|nr:hypothetical protein [Rhodopirellula baltica]EGF24186.1 hypothetical protein RBWH47_00941 [Rhodopirellula baltica WH47]
MVFTVAAHKIDARTTCGDAIEHSFDMSLLNMVTAFDEAMAGQHIGTNGLAFLAVLDAFLH